MSVGGLLMVVMTFVTVMIWVGDSSRKKAGVAAAMSIDKMKKRSDGGLVLIKTMGAVL